VFSPAGLGTFPVVPPDNQKHPDVSAHMPSIFHHTSGDSIFYLRGHPGHGFYRVYLFFIPGTPSDPDFKLAVVFGINDSIFPLPYPRAPGFDHPDFVPVIFVYLSRTFNKRLFCN
jgi:hypothetical protein